jgi:hypothetical protein
MPLKKGDFKKGVGIVAWQRLLWFLRDVNSEASSGSPLLRWRRGDRKARAKR